MQSPGAGGSSDESQVSEEGSSRSVDSTKVVHSAMNDQNTNECTNNDVMLDEQIEALIGCKIDKKNTLYLVKWKNDKDPE